MFLPTNDAVEAGAVTRVVSDLRARFGGCTRSLLQQPVFRGYWLDKDSETGAATLYIDQVSLVISDVSLSPDDPNLLNSVSELKATAESTYEILGSRQLEVWLIVQPATRVAG